MVCTRFRLLILQNPRHTIPHIPRSAFIVVGVEAGEHVDSVLQATSCRRKVFSMFYSMTTQITHTNPVDSPIADFVRHP
jgi:hypothetical protein